MYYIKLFTSPSFDRSDFCDVLRNKCNVRCCTTEGGIILDLQAFKELRLCDMPYWVYINRKDILSPLHTRPAFPEEYEALETKHRFKMVAYDKRDDNFTSLLEEDDFQYLAELARDYKNELSAYRENLTLYIMDNFTHEMLLTI